MKGGSLTSVAFSCHCREKFPTLEALVAHVEKEHAKKMTVFKSVAPPLSTIWKFPVPIADEFAVGIPRGAEILSFDIQAGQPCIWAAVDPEQEAVSRQFRIVGTGHDMPAEALAYIGTVLDGGLVWHLFEKGGGSSAS